MCVGCVLVACWLCVVFCVLFLCGVFVWCVCVVYLCGVFVWCVVWCVGVFLLFGFGVGVSFTFASPKCDMHLSSDRLRMRIDTELRVPVTLPCPALRARSPLEAPKETACTALDRAWETNAFNRAADMTQNKMIESIDCRDSLQLAMTWRCVGAGSVVGRSLGRQSA